MQEVQYSLFPSDAELKSDGITYRYMLPIDFCSSKNEKKIIVEDFQFWEFMSMGENEVHYYEPRSGICLHADFADTSIGVKTTGENQSANLNFVGLSNNDGTWCKYKEFIYYRSQRYIEIKFRDLLGHYLTNSIGQENPRYLFAIILKLQY